MENTENKKQNNTEEFAIYDKAISILATLAMGILIIMPLLASLLLFVNRNIDDVLNFHRRFALHLAFPLACFLIFATYLIPILVGQNRIRDIGRYLVNNPIYLIFILLIIWFFISQIYNAPSIIYIKFYHDWLGESFTLEVAYFIFILFGSIQIKETSQKRLLLRIHMIGSLLVIAAGQIIWNSELVSVTNDFWGPRGSIFPQVNNYGYYLAVSASLSGGMFIYEKHIIWKVISGISFVFNSLALSINNTFGAWIAVASAIVFIVIANAIWKRTLDWKIFILIPIYVVCIFTPAHLLGTFEENFISLGTDINKMVEGEDTDEIGTGRGIIWKASMDIIEENKVLGIGFEGVYYWCYEGPPYNIRPHNEFMQYALFHGIPAAILYFLGCFSIFLRGLRKKSFLDGETLVCLTSAFAYLVSSFFGLTLFSSTYFLFIYLGMGYVKKKEKTEKDK